MEREPQLGLVAVVDLDEAKTAHMEKIVALYACLLGVITGFGSNQMQVVLNLMVPIPKALSKGWL